MLPAVLAMMVMPAGPAGAAPDGPPPDDIDGYPLAEGNYTNSGPSYFGWAFFKTPAGWSCGMAPNGGPIGFDAVPADAPPGTNQTFADASRAAVFRYSDTPTFTRDFPVLPAGQRVETRGAGCAIDLDGAVHCQTEGNHGFILSADRGVLW